MAVALISRQRAWNGSYLSMRMRIKEINCFRKQTREKSHIRIKYIKN